MRWFGVFAIGMLAACNPMANLEEAETRIEEFQAAYSVDDVDDMYEMTGPEFRKVTTREEFDDLYALIDLRLGAVEASERTGFNVNTNNGRTVTVVSMQSEFELGEGIETYTFFGHGEDMELVGWNVNSPNLTLTSEDIRKLSEDEAQAEPAG